MISLALERNQNFWPLDSSSIFSPLQLADTNKHIARGCCLITLLRRIQPSRTNGAWSIGRPSILPYITPMSLRNWACWSFLTSPCAFPLLCLDVCCPFPEMTPFPLFSAKRVGIWRDCGWFISFPSLKFHVPHHTSFPNINSYHLYCEYGLISLWEKYIIFMLEW